MNQRVPPTYFDGGSSGLRSCSSYNSLSYLAGIGSEKDRPPANNVIHLDDSSCSLIHRDDSQDNDPMMPVSRADDSLDNDPMMPVSWADDPELFALDEGSSPTHLCKLASVTYVLRADSRHHLSAHARFLACSPDTI